MKNQISLSGMCLAAVLLLAAGSPPLQAQARTAPEEDEQAFHRLVVGQRMIDEDYPSPFYYWEFVAAGRFEAGAGAETVTGSYSYANTGVNTGDLVLNPDNEIDGREESGTTAHLVFTSTTAGDRRFPIRSDHALLPRLRGWSRVVRAAGGQQYQHHRERGGPRCSL